MTDDETTLNRLFESYRAACPEIEPGSLFMPRLWQKIESRQSFRSAFERLSRLFAAASAAVCLLLLVLNLVSAPQTRLPEPSYTDALVAEHSAEQTYYTEAIWTGPQGMGQIPALQH
jgi:hypothetical protein